MKIKEIRDLLDGKNAIHTPKLNYKIEYGVLGVLIVPKTDLEKTAMAIRLTLKNVKHEVRESGIYIRIV